MSNGDNLFRIDRFLKKNWFEPTGLIAALVVTGIVEGTLFATAGASATVVTSTLVSSEIVVLILWGWSVRLPRTPKKSIGFLVSIDCADDKESEKLRQDFVTPLRQLVKSGAVGRAFHFMELPQHHAKKIQDHSDAETFRRKTKAHFVLFGRVRLRVVSGKEHHVIDLEGGVSHKPVPVAASQSLAQEFTRLLPRRVRTPTENDLLTLQFTSEWAGKVAMYVIGVAAAFSGDFDYAESLYTNVLNELREEDKKFPIYAELAQRIPDRISELYESRVQAAHFNWTTTHDPMYVDAVGTYLEKIHVSPDNHDGFYNMSAIHAFLKNRDVQNAKMFLRKMKKKNTGTWNYNMGFLLAYSGDLQSALRHYRRATTYFVEVEVINQIEDFLWWVFETEPNKYQLLYCLGFFEWKAKGDLVSAKSNFKEFLGKGNASEFRKEREFAAKWIKEINELLVSQAAAN